MMHFPDAPKLLKFALVATLVIGLSACSDENDDQLTIPSPSLATLEANSQVTSQNWIEVQLADVPTNGWIVIHADNGNNGPLVPAIISEPTFVEAGSNSSVMVALASDASIMDGEIVWVMLHEDTGMPLQYEFDGSNSLDSPFMANGEMVMTSIQINSAAITVSDMDISGNTVVIPEVLAAADGWLVLHNDNGMGGIVLPGIIGKVQVNKGMNTNVSLSLDGGVMLNSGQKLFPMLHLDNGTIGVYEFDGVGVFDGPEVFGNDAFPGNVIFTSFTVLNVN